MTSSFREGGRGQPKDDSVLCGGRGGLKNPQKGWCNFWMLPYMWISPKLKDEISNLERMYMLIVFKHSGSIFTLNMNCRKQSVATFIDLHSLLLTCIQFYLLVLTYIDCYWLAFTFIDLVCSTWTIPNATAQLHFEQFIW